MEVSRTQTAVRDWRYFSAFASKQKKNKKKKKKKKTL
jgi:hypothetical protein